MGRASTPKETIVCIERILLDESDADRGEYLTISKLRELLISHFGIEVSKETVADCLETLEGETLGLPRNAYDRANSPLVPSYELVSPIRKKPNSPKKYAIKRLYSTAQIKHLIRHLRRDDTSADSLESEHLLLKLLNRSTREEFDEDLYTSDPLADNGDRPEENASPSNATDLKALLSKVDLLDTAIRERVKIRFRAGLESRENAREPRMKEWTPYLVAPSDGYYYLFVRPQGSHSKYDVIPYRVDTLTDLKLTCTPIEDRLSYEIEQEKAKRIFRAGIARWFGRSTTDIVTTVVAFSDKACKDKKKQRYLFEALKGKRGFERVQETEDGRPQFRFEASRQAMEIWACRMSDLFEVVEPKTLREAVMDKLRCAVTRSAYNDSNRKELGND